MDISKTGGLSGDSDAYGVGCSPTKEKATRKRVIATNEWKRECLEDYVRERMTPHEFAEHIGVSKNRVYYILSGKEWKTVERPEGFQYPWPEREKLGSRSSFQRRVQEYDAAIRLREENGWTMIQLADYLGVGKGSGSDIVRRVKLWRQRGY